MFANEGGRTRERERERYDNNWLKSYCSFHILWHLSNHPFKGNSGYYVLCQRKVFHDKWTGTKCLSLSIHKDLIVIFLFTEIKPLLFDCFRLFYVYVGIFIYSHRCNLFSLIVWGAWGHHLLIPAMFIGPLALDDRRITLDDIFSVQSYKLQSYVYH